MVEWKKVYQVLTLSGENHPSWPFIIGVSIDGSSRTPRAETFKDTLLKVDKTSCIAEMDKVNGGWVCTVVHSLSKVDGPFKWPICPAIDETAIVDSR